MVLMHTFGGKCIIASYTVILHWMINFYISLYSDHNSWSNFNSFSSGCSSFLFLAGFMNLGVVWRISVVQNPVPKMEIAHASYYFATLKTFAKIYAPSIPLIRFHFVSSLPSLIHPTSTSKLLMPWNTRIKHTQYHCRHQFSNMFNLCLCHLFSAFCFMLFFHITRRKPLAHILIARG